MAQCQHPQERVVHKTIGLDSLQKGQILFVSCCLDCGQIDEWASWTGPSSHVGRLPINRDDKTIETCHKRFYNAANIHGAPFSSDTR